MAAAATQQGAYSGPMVRKRIRWPKTRHTTGSDKATHEKEFENAGRHGARDWSALALTQVHHGSRLSDSCEDGEALSSVHSTALAEGNSESTNYLKKTGGKYMAAHLWLVSQRVFWGVRSPGLNLSTT